MTFARYPSLENRVVFISGGGSGIGAAMVEAFAEIIADFSAAEQRALFHDNAARLYRFPTN